jgi:hypothetical protein
LIEKILFFEFKWNLKVKGLLHGWKVYNDNAYMMKIWVWVMWDTWLCKMLSFGHVVICVGFSALIE